MRDKSCIFRLLALAMMLSVFMVPVLRAQDDNQVHTVKAGDTLAKLAEKYLGDKKFWKELATFNELPATIGPNEQPAVGEIMIPGGVRTRALAKLEKAREAHRQARTAKAGDFAKVTFRKAEDKLNSAERSFANTKYSKAGSFADIAAKVFIEAISLADRQAVVSRKVSVARVYGEVKIQSTEGRKWRVLEADQKVVPGDRLQTGDKAGVVLAFRDMSVLKVREQSEVVLKTYSNDLRTDKTNVEILLEVGTIDGEIKRMPVPDSSFTIQAKGNSFNLGNDRFFLRYGIGGDVALAVYEGEANVTLKGTETLPVKANRGILITNTGDVKVAQSLLASPKQKTPKNNGPSFNQKPELEWHKALGVASYRVEVSADVSFFELIDDLAVNGLSVNTSTLDVGQYYWRVSSIDQNGLVGPPGDGWTVFIKRNLELVMEPSDDLLEKAGMPYASVKHQFNIRPKQQENSVDWIEVSVDGGTFKRLEGPIQFNRQGPHSIKYRAVDVRNERQKLDEYNVFIDDTKPEVFIGADKDIFEVDDSKFAPLERVYYGMAKDKDSGIRNILVKTDEGEFMDKTPEALRDKGKGEVVSKHLKFALEGKHVITVRAQDLAGNWSEEKDLKVTVDKNPPEVKIVPGEVVYQKGDVQFVSSRCQFHFDPTDDRSGVSHVLASVDGGEFAKIAAMLPGLPGGPHVIQFKAVDNVGNTGEADTFKFEVDALAPQTQMGMNPALVKYRDRLFGPRGFELKFMHRDDKSGVGSIKVDINDEMLDGVLQEPGKPMKFVKEGTYRIAYHSIDNVKNVEEDQEVTFTVDGTAPEVTVSIEGPKHQGMGRLFISGKSTIHLTAKDGVSGVNRIEWKKNGGMFSVFKGALKGLREEALQLTYRSIDNVGNVSDKKDIRITVDNTIPQVWIEERRDGSYVIQALDGLSGVHEIYAKIDGGELKRYKDRDVLPEGSMVVFQAIDNVGNQTEKIEKALK